MTIRDRVVELRRVPASELLANPKNFREHGEAQRKAMQGLFTEIGYADALIARETPEGLQLLDGHMRQGLSEDQEVPVLIVDLDDAEADALLLSHDPVGLMAKFDDVAFADLVKSVRDEGKNMEAFIDDLAAGEMKATLKLNPEEIVEDEPVEIDAPEEPTTEPGDVWCMGDHRLICGDATDPKVVATLLGDEVPKMMITDPPYGVDYDPNWRNDAALLGDLAWGAARTGTVANDDQADWRDAWKLFPGDIAYVWHASIYKDVPDGLADCDFVARNQIVWVKPSIAISRGHYNWQHEVCLYAVRKGATADWIGPKNESTVWKIQHLAATGQKEPRGQENAQTIHGTQKPVACMARPMANHGKRGDGVYEPFAGSGSTIIAAEQVGRRCFAIELDPHYCDIIVERWQKFADKSATIEGYNHLYSQAKKMRAGNSALSCGQSSRKEQRKLDGGCHGPKEKTD